MTLAEYHRQQAATCQRLARTSFDLATAERLRFMAFQPHMHQGNGFAGSNGASGLE